VQFARVVQRQLQELSRMWACPVCGGRDGTTAFSTMTASADATEGGVDPRAFRPSADQFGRLVGTAMRCSSCGHASVEAAASDRAITVAYADASDPVSVREEAGQVETARRALVKIEAAGRKGRLLDVGCWTGSFLVAATERGWDAEGIEPSRWAGQRATERGMKVHTGELGDAALPAGSFDAVVCCDVLEHLADPGAAVEQLRTLLRDGGVLYVTVPDAGSGLARVMGRRWWSVLPMHLQYFTRSSMRQLLTRHGFDIRSIGNHPKVFSAHYYAERFASFVPVVGPLVERVVVRSRRRDRLIAPDFRDRFEVIAVKR
jgi:SAM-dependent methyltransferase